METFILGVLSSILASILIYVLRYQFAFLVNMIFFMIYPKVSGKYNVYTFDKKKKTRKKQKAEKEDFLRSDAGDEALLKFLKKGEKNYDKMQIRQFAFSVTGEISTTKKGEVVNVEKFKGKVTPNGVLILNTELDDDGHHSYGTYLFTLNHNFNIIRGIRSFLCIGCGNADYKYILLEKI